MKKHIVCFGDSNTHGYCAVPQNCADGGDRFNEQERWTCLLAKALGDDYLVLEEGLSGRTTVFNDPIHEGLSGVDYIVPCLMSHEPVDLLVIMLGTNDTKERFNANPALIALGMERLIGKAKSAGAWKNGKPNILVICPPHILPHFHVVEMGTDCPEKSRQLATYYAEICRRQGCAFLDAEGLAEFNQKDCMHLTKHGHFMLAQKLAQLIPTLV